MNYFIKRLKTRTEIARSYIFEDVSYDGELPDGKMTFKFKRNKYSKSRENYIKTFVYSRAADTPRPITLVNKDGVWKVDECSSVFVGVTPRKK